ncbi:MAG: RNA polymerase sigma factor [Armatimonadetes bacterium]|nr:RNA polymerase sigma factor [Armatimonadota bacterium]
MTEPGDSLAPEALRALVESARSGDRAAFGELYDRFERSLYRLCWELLGDPDAAADAVQEAFTGAWSRIAKLRHPEAFASWLRMAAVNACRHHHRRTWWQRTWTDVFGERPEEQSDPGGGPAHRVESEELTREVRRALSGLPAAQREVIVLHHLEGLPLDQIAALLGVAEGTVKSRLGRGRARLAELLRPYVESDDVVAEA